MTSTVYYTHMRRFSVYRQDLRQQREDVMPKWTPDSEITTTLTPAEEAARADVGRLHDEMQDALRRARRVCAVGVREPGGSELTPCCPYCGSTDTKYDEDETISRDFLKVREDGTLVFDCDITQDYESDRDGRVFCGNCGLDSRLPDDLEYDWA